jgi:hypothetical protein
VNLPDGERIAALAARLQLTPRQLLALAARVADPDVPLDTLRLDREIAIVRAAADSAEAAADLALLGYASYALDDIDHALKRVWSDTCSRGL